jgi:hypothetical protein
VEAFQRHELTLLRIEDTLNHDWGSAAGKSGQTSGRRSERMYYAIIGAMPAVAQTISYEVRLAIIFLFFAYPFTLNLLGEIYLIISVVSISNLMIAPAALL